MIQEQFAADDHANFPRLVGRAVVWGRDAQLADNLPVKVRSTRGEALRLQNQPPSQSNPPASALRWCRMIVDTLGRVSRCKSSL